MTPRRTGPLPAASLAYASAADLGRRLARCEVSPVEIVNEQLQRIERLDPELGCYITVLAERALQEAREAEAEIANRRPRGPLHGVPLALKDIFDTAGVRTTSGSKILAENVPERDAAVVERLCSAGAILLGKLNMHEFAFGLTTTNPHYGPCRNPWNQERVPGGSSGGSGAALAAGLCTLSLGTDTGGSIRIPASACGIVGLKPTFGRVSRRGVLPLSWSLDHVGPMTRTVEDAALVLHTIAGHDIGDPWSANEPAPDYLTHLEGGVKGTRIGIARDYFFENLAPDVERAVDDAIGTLERLGAGVHTVTLPHIEHAHTALHAILASEAAAYHRPWMQRRPDDYGEDVRHAIELGYFIPAVDYVNARRMQTLVQESMVATLREVEVLLAPTLPHAPPSIGEPVTREPGAAWNRLITAFNLAGVPALSLPCGFDREGLPIGLQIVGRPFDEATMLRVGYAYERETEWQARRPPV